MSYDLPFVSNDGNYLVLVTTAYAKPDADAIKVYKYKWDLNNENNAELIKVLRIKDIWTENELNERKVGDFITDHTPVWFEDGKFDYSSDGKNFVYTTHTGREIKISLSSGE